MKRELKATDEFMMKVIELRRSGMKDFICETFYKKLVNYNYVDTTLKPVIVHTAHGISSYANQMYAKYGDSCKVRVGYFDSDLNYKELCTYSA